MANALAVMFPLPCTLHVTLTNYPACCYAIAMTEVLRSFHLHLVWKLRSINISTQLHLINTLLTMKTLFQSRLILLNILLSMILFVSCEKNDEDLSLKDQITGTWKSTDSYYKSYTFNKDNTFIDTTFYLPSSNPSYFEVSEVISGYYTIENGQLNFSDIRLEYFKGQDSENLLKYSSTYAPVYEISFNGETLVLTQKDIFEPVNKTTSGIVGKWINDKLVAVYNENTENKFTGGTLHGLYDFKENLSLNWQYEMSYDSGTDTGNSSTSYIFNNPILTIDQWGLHELTVSFSKNRMIWVYNDRTFKRIK